MGQDSILLFDGECNLCNGAVDFVIRRDKKRQFRFAALQSPAGARLRQSLSIPPQVDSLVLIEDGVAYIRSSAALRVAGRLNMPWPLLWVFMLVPRVIRDAVYECIARNRYRWLGKRDTCRVATEEERSRFIET
jgi:predicted DCC family thiol-disulfide oxidoreductase YuxK